MAKPRTLFDKIWDSHLVHTQDDGTCVLYIDRHLIHEVTSPQAFEGLWGCDLVDVVPVDVDEALAIVQPADFVHRPELVQQRTGGLRA